MRPIKTRPAAVIGPRKWKRDTALDALAAAIERSGRMPRLYDLAPLGAPSATTLCKLFGNREHAERLARKRIPS